MPCQQTEIGALIQYPSLIGPLVFCHAEAAELRCTGPEKEILGGVLLEFPPGFCCCQHTFSKTAKKFSSLVGWQCFQDVLQLREPQNWARAICARICCTRLWLVGTWYCFQDVLQLQQLQKRVWAIYARICCTGRAALVSDWLVLLSGCPTAVGAPAGGGAVQSLSTRVLLYQVQFLKSIHN